MNEKQFTERMQTAVLTETREVNGTFYAIFKTKDGHYITMAVKAYSE